MRFREMKKKNGDVEIEQWTWESVNFDDIISTENEY